MKVKQKYVMGEGGAGIIGNSGSASTSGIAEAEKDINMANDMVDINGEMIEINEE